MATITINISDDDNIKSTTSNNQGGEISSASENATDGGAPKIVTASAAPEQLNSGQLDIGGPPQWLTDALGKEEKKQEANAAGLDVEQQGTDGGAPKADMV